MICFENIVRFLEYRNGYGLDKYKKIIEDLIKTCIDKSKCIETNKIDGNKYGNRYNIDNNIIIDFIDDTSSIMIYYNDTNENIILSSIFQEILKHMRYTLSIPEDVLVSAMSNNIILDLIREKNINNLIEKLTTINENKQTPVVNCNGIKTVPFTTENKIFIERDNRIDDDIYKLVEDIFTQKNKAIHSYILENMKNDKVVFRINENHSDDVLVKLDSDEWEISVQKDRKVCVVNK